MPKHRLVEKLKGPGRHDSEKAWRRCVWLGCVGWRGLPLVALHLETLIRGIDAEQAFVSALGQCSSMAEVEEEFFCYRYHPQRGNLLIEIVGLRLSQHRVRSFAKKWLSREAQ